MIKVLVIMGSASDAEKIAPCGKVLEELKIPYELTVSSAHRTPDRTVRLIAEAEKKGAEVFICAAGMAAHLAGSVAAHTLKPVIGIPVSGSALGGMDALFSTVQMPAGFPVATVALDKAGAANAAWLAAQILALQDADLKERIALARKEMEAKVLKSAEEIKSSR